MPLSKKGGRVDLNAWSVNTNHVICIIFAPNESLMIAVNSYMVHNDRIVIFWSYISIFLCFKNNNAYKRQAKYHRLWASGTLLPPYLIYATIILSLNMICTN